VAADLTPALHAEAVMGIVVRYAAQQLLPVFQRTAGQSGYVCAQVDPSRAGDREAMLAMGRRFAAWAPNIAVKLPATAAGLDVAEELAAEGATVTITVSFTVPQVLAAAERHRLGLARARLAGKSPGRCFAVIMIGRLDDYLRDIAMDRQAAVGEDDIRRAGLAVVKRAYGLFQDRGYEATLLVAALRGVYHLTELAGGRLVMSVHPSIQTKLFAPDLPRQARIDLPVDAAAISRLGCLPDFVRAYEPDGMAPEDFASFGLTQRTLSQFMEAGWKLLETLK
jgi:transaldolase